MHLQRLAQDKARLGHRPVVGVNDQQDPVDHLEDAFDFTAEIGVSGRVDNIDARIAVADGGVFRQDGDTALALQVVGVHDLADHLFVVPKHAALPKQGVDDRGLAVVDMGDDRNVAQLVHLFDHVLVSVLPNVPPVRIM